MSELDTVMTRDVRGVLSIQKAFEMIDTVPPTLRLDRCGNTLQWWSASYTDTHNSSLVRLLLDQRGGMRALLGRK